MESFGPRLRKYRKQKGMLQTELAATVGVSSQVISNLERGYTTGLSVDLLMALAGALDISVAELSGDDLDGAKSKAAPVQRRPLTAEQSRLLAEASGLDVGDMQKVIEYVELLKLKRNQ